MIETLLTNSYFVTIGSIIAVITIFSIFKKLFKITITAVIIFTQVCVYFIETGKKPKDIVRTIEVNKNNIERNTKKITDGAKIVIDNIDNTMPKDAKKTVESFARSMYDASKTIGKKEIQKSAEELQKNMEKIMPIKEKRTAEKLLSPIEKEKNKAKKKLKKSLEKYKKELAN